MTPREAIADARRAHETRGARWPVPLLAYLIDTRGETRAFDWLCSCIGDLLTHLGKASAESDAALSLARQQASEGGDLETIEQVASGFWSRRTPEDPSLTALAQLLFAQSRGELSEGLTRIGSWSTPICLLERLEARRGEILEMVISRFASSTK